MRLLATLALCLLLAPVAGACPSSYVTQPMPNGGTLYVGDDGSLWEETNMLPGLQCSYVVKGGRVHPPDTRVML